MELWIRSQSKETLMKVTKVHICDGVIFANGYTEFDERIGEYATKERAIEILDEIQKFLKTAELNDDINVIVYKMPEN